MTASTLGEFVSPAPVNDHFGDGIETPSTYVDLQTKEQAETYLAALAPATSWVPLGEAAKDLGLRALHNGWQAAVPLLAPILTFQVAGWSWAVVLSALIAFGLSAAVSAAKSYLTWKVVPVPPLNWYANLAISAATAFVGTLAGVVAASGPIDLLSLNWGSILQTCAGAAVLAVGKAWIALRGKSIADYNAEATTKRVTVKLAKSEQARVVELAQELPETTEPEYDPRHDVEDDAA